MKNQGAVGGGRWGPLASAELLVIVVVVVVELERETCVLSTSAWMQTQTTSSRLLTQSCSAHTQGC